MAKSHEVQIALQFRQLVRTDLKNGNKAGLLFLLSQIIALLLNEEVEEWDDRVWYDELESCNIYKKRIVHPSFPGWEIGVHMLRRLTQDSDYELRFHGVLMGQSFNPYDCGWYIGEYVNSHTKPDLPCLWDDADTDGLDS